MDVETRPCFLYFGILKQENRVIIRHIMEFPWAQNGMKQEVVNNIVNHMHAFVFGMTGQLTELFPPEFCSSKYRWEIRHEGNRGKNFDKNFFRAVDNEFNRVLKSLYIPVEYVRAQKF